MRTNVAGLIALAACMLGLAACDKESKGLVLLPEKAPEITLQPASVTVAVGAAAEFTVVADGENLSYQWSKDSVPIGGATAATYRISATTSTSAGIYRVVVSNATRSTTSTGAVLTVTGANLPPAIVTHPESRTFLPGALATLTVVASGTPPLTYQWFKNDVAIFLDADEATYNLPSATTQDSGNYKVTVTNAYGTITSNVAELTISASGTLSGVVSAKASALQLAVDCHDPATSRILAEKAGAAWLILFGETHDFAPIGAQGQEADLQSGSPECGTGSGIAVADTNPVAATGVLVSSLRADQQELVTAAIAQLVWDQDDAASARRLAELTSGNAYAETYIAWGGSAESAFANGAADATYLLINGPRLWIEIFRRPGAQMQGASYQVVVTTR